MKTPFSHTAFWTLCFLLLTFSAFPQKIFNSYALKDFVEEHGNITTAFIDSRSNIWIGTSSAEVILYDGISWKHFGIDTLKLGRTYDSINSFYEDSQSRIWIATDGGIVLYNNGAWKTFREEVPQYYTHNIKEWNGKMYFSSFRGINIYEGGKWKFIDLPTSISAADLEVDMDNKLWACFTNGDPCFIFNGDKWNEINSENSDICDGYMSNLHLSNDSILYFIGPFGYFCSYNGTNFTNLKQHINKLSFSYLAAIVSSSNGKDLFIAGASLYNDNGIIAQFTENNTTYFDFNEGLIKQLIVDMVLDANGKLMVFSEDSISYEGTLLATTTSEVELFQDFIESKGAFHDFVK